MPFINTIASYTIALIYYIHILLGIIVYAITGDFKKMTIINILFHGMQIIIYYFHERTWEKTSWGKNIHPLSCLPVKGNLTKEDLVKV